MLSQLQQILLLLFLFCAFPFRNVEISYRRYKFMVIGKRFTGRAYTLLLLCTSELVEIVGKRA